MVLEQRQQHRFFLLHVAAQQIAQLTRHALECLPAARVEPAGRCRAGERGRFTPQRAHDHVVFGQVNADLRIAELGETAEQMGFLEVEVTRDFRFQRRRHFAQQLYCREIGLVRRRGGLADVPAGAVSGGVAGVLGAAVIVAACRAVESWLGASPPIWMTAPLWGLIGTTMAGLSLLLVPHGRLAEAKP